MEEGKSWVTARDEEQREFSDSIFFDSFTNPLSINNIIFLSLSVYYVI